MSYAQVHLRINGLVQGVGYRFFCLQRARHLGVTGTVRNLPDGCVEVVAEGDKGALNTLIHELKVGPFTASVRKIDIDWRPYTGEYKNFEVIH